MLRSDITTFTLCLDAVTSPLSLFEQCHTTLSTLLDKHAPFLTRTITIRPKVPWLNGDVKMAKQKRRQLVRSWRQSRFTIHRDPFKVQIRHVNLLIASAKYAHYSAKITEAACDIRQLYNIVNARLIKLEAGLSACVQRTNLPANSVLTRIQNGHLMALDNKRVVVLVLLDLSAAFDTVDNTLLACMQRTGVTDVAHQRFESYLSAMIQTVCIGQTKSDPLELLQGVPRGSGLGPVSFTLYTGLIGQIIRRHRLDFYLFAGDSQLHVSFKIKDPNFETIALARIQACVETFKACIIHHRLQLNDSKTEVLMITTPSSACKHNLSDFVIGDSILEPTTIARNLGVMFYSAFNMKSQVSKLFQAAYCHLHMIARHSMLLNYWSTPSLSRDLTTETASSTAYRPYY